MNGYSKIFLSAREKESWDLIKDSKKVAITSHIHPDGDAIGSCIALQRYCKSKGLEAKIFIDDHIPEIFDFLPDVGLISRLDGEVIADTLVIVDTNIRRIGKAASILADNTINIDHHSTNQGECGHSIIRENMTSTAELLCRVFMSESYKIDAEMANCLYTGIISDTVFLKIPMETPDAFFIAGELIRLGAEHAYISQRLSTKSIDDFNRTIKAYNILERFRSDTIVGITLDESFDDLELTDEIIDTIRYLRGVEIAYLLKHESKGGYRVRLRSQTRDVSFYAKKHGGGGHADAAGFTINIDDAQLARDTLLEDLITWLG